MSRDDISEKYILRTKWVNSYKDNKKSHEEKNNQSKSLLLGLSRIGCNGSLISYWRNGQRNKKMSCRMIAWNIQGQIHSECFNREHERQTKENINTKNDHKYGHPRIQKVHG